MQSFKTNELLQDNCFNQQIINEFVKKLTAQQRFNQYLYGKELQYLLNFSERTLSRWRTERKRGKLNVGIPCTLIGNKYIYLVSDICKYLIKNSL